MASGNNNKKNAWNLHMLKAWSSICTIRRHFPREINMLLGLPQSQSELLNKKKLATGSKSVPATRTVMTEPCRETISGILTGLSLESGVTSDIVPTRAPALSSGSHPRPRVAQSLLSPSMRQGLLFSIKRNKRSHRAGLGIRIHFQQLAWHSEVKQPKEQSKEVAGAE